MGKVFKTSTEIHIISHLDLKTKKLNDYIPSRHELVNFLEEESKKLGIHFHNVGKIVEATDPGAMLEDYMSDGTHYSKGYDEIKRKLIAEIEK